MVENKGNKEFYVEQGKRIYKLVFIETPLVEHLKRSKI